MSCGWRVLILLVALHFLYACRHASDDGRGQAPAEKRAAAVVADISAGTNPYHKTFRRPEWLEHPCTVVPGLPCAIPTLNLTLGEDYAQSLEADLQRGAWAAYQPGVVHWVRGTNLLLLTQRSFQPFVGGVADGYGGYNTGHGVATSAAVSKACPDCYVLIVQDATSLDGAPVAEIVKSMPWVDMVVQTTLADYDKNGAEMFVEGGLRAATKALSDSGRLYFAGSGNRPVSSAEPAITQYQFPPWVVSVGGAHYENSMRHYFPEAASHCYAAEFFSGKPMDVAGQFAQALAWVESIDQEGVFTGTSFAAPQVAGSVAQVLVELRRFLGDQRTPGRYWSGIAQPAGPLGDGFLEADELMAAVQSAARHFQTGHFEEACIPLGGLYMPVPVSPTPWVDMGWGYFGADEVLDAVDILLGARPPTEKPETAFYQSSVRELRSRIP